MAGKNRDCPGLSLFFPSPGVDVLFRWVLALPIVVVSVGCSVRKYAINQVGDILLSGGSIYESDEDIEFVGDALPFSLKLVESLIDESPKHRGLPHRRRQRVHPTVWHAVC